MRCFRVWLLSAVLACSALPASAMSVLPPTFEELVSESATITRATVKAVEPVISTFASGTRVVRTRVTWKVEHTLKGLPEQTLVLEFLGGDTPDFSTVVPGMPQFKVGDSDYLFVGKTRNSICPLIAANYGRYPIEVDPKSGALTVPKATSVVRPSKAGAAFPQAATPPSLDEFEAAILSRVNALKP